MAERSFSQSKIVPKRIAMNQIFGSPLGGNILIPKIVLKRIDVKKELDTLSGKNVASKMHSRNSQNLSVLKVKEEFLVDENEVEKTKFQLPSNDIRINFIPKNGNTSSHSAVSPLPGVGLDPEEFSNVIPNSAHSNTKETKEPQNLIFELVGLLEGSSRKENRNESEDPLKLLRDVECKKTDEYKENERFIFSTDCELVALKQEELILDDTEITESEICANDAAVARCLAESGRRSGLRKNLKVQSYNSPYDCDHCTLKFRFLKDLNQHLKGHKKEVFSPSCPIELESGKNLFEKIQTHSKKNSYCCTKCTLKFNSQEDLKLHSKKHRNLVECATEVRKPKITSTGGNIYSCSHCPVKTKWKTALSRHLKLHFKDENEVFTCKVCFRQFFHYRSYKRHAMVHSTRKPFSCPYCPAQLKQKRSYRDHIQKHENKRKNPFKHNISTPSFVDNFSHILKDPITLLTGHSRNRSRGIDEKPFACSYCSSRFLGSCDLARHIKDVHMSTSEYHCKLCPRTFCHLSTLKRHFQSHLDLFSCELCPASFAEKRNLKNHLLGHFNGKWFMCAYCFVKFKKRSLLKAHIKASHADERFLDESSRLCKVSVQGKEKRYACAHCPAKFKVKHTLTRHLFSRAHSTEKGHKCIHCPAKFFFKRSLKHHLQTHAIKKPPETIIKSPDDFILMNEEYKSL